MRKTIHEFGTKVHKNHLMRKNKDDELPNWKYKWNHFNETRLGKLEHFVEVAIPWFVLILLFIILGEFSYELNFFNWSWLNSVGDFFAKYHTPIHLFDQIIIGFFVVDLYFNFFKKKTFWIFLKTSFIDIIAIAPLGLILRFARVGEAQTALHVGAEIEKGTVRIIRESEFVSKMFKMENLYKINRLPRLFRLHNVKDAFFDDENKKKSEIKEIFGKKRRL